MSNAQRICIALGSTHSKPGCVEENLREIESYANMAKEVTADILLTPEMSASGYGPYDEVVNVAEVAGGPIYQSLRQMARDYGMVICAGFAERTAGKTTDKPIIAHYIVYPEQDHPLVQRKNRLTGKEEDRFRPAVDESSLAQFATFKVHGVNCRLAVCSDACIEELPERFRQEKVQLLLNPGAQCYEVESLRAIDYSISLAESGVPPGELPQSYDQSYLEYSKQKIAIGAVSISGHDQYTGTRSGRLHFGYGLILSRSGDRLYGRGYGCSEVPAFGYEWIDV